MSFSSSIKSCLQRWNYTRKALTAPALPMSCCYMNATTGTDRPKSLVMTQKQLIFGLFASNIKVYVYAI